MPSLHQYLLTGFVQYLDDSIIALFRATVHVDYNWAFLQDGTAIAKLKHVQQGDPDIQGIEFLVFGVVRCLMSTTPGRFAAS
jgi:hypothetical protein